MHVHVPAAKFILKTHNNKEMNSIKTQKNMTKKSKTTVEQIAKGRRVLVLQCRLYCIKIGSFEATKKFRADARGSRGRRGGEGEGRTGGKAT